MGDRYWISGVQLGILIALNEEEERRKLIDKIVDKQFMGNKKDFEYVDYRYYCIVCTDNIPAFKEQPERQRLYCRKCDKWQMFEKKIRPK